MIPSRLIENLELLPAVFQFAANPAADIVDTRIEPHNALVALCSQWPQNTGEVITDYPTWNIGAPGPCIPCDQLVAGQVRALETRDVLEDPANDSAVYCLLSKKRYTGGVVNITGINVKWVGQGCPTATTSLKYVFATNSMQLSVDGGATWTISVPVPAIGEYSYAIASGVNAAIVWFEVTGALPGSDQVDALALSDTQFTVMYQSWVEGAPGSSPVRRPYVLPANTSVMIVQPVVVDFGSVSVYYKWLTFDLAYNWTDPIRPDLPAGSLIAGYGALVIPAQNTFTLPAVPTTPALTDVWVYGSRAIYGIHYTLAGATGTWLPAAAGFPLETTDASNTFAKVW